MQVFSYNYFKQWIGNALFLFYQTGSHTGVYFSLWRTILNQSECFFYQTLPLIDANMCAKFKVAFLAQCKTQKFEILHFFRRSKSHKNTVDFFFNGAIKLEMRL